MNTTFSFNRIKLLMRADWIEYKMNFLYGMGVFILVWACLLSFGLVNDAHKRQSVAYVFGIIILFLYFCQHVNRRVHRSKCIYLTLPASGTEKYLTFFLELLVFLLAYLAIFWGGLWMKKLFVPEFNMINFHDTLFDLKGGLVMGIMAALFFISSITFRKRGPLIALAGLSAYTLLFNFLMGYIILKQNVLQFGLLSKQAFALPGLNQNSAAIRTFHFMGEWFVPMAIISTLILLYVGYLKLKEKELR